MSAIAGAVLQALRRQLEPAAAQQPAPQAPMEEEAAFSMRDVCHGIPVGTHVDIAFVQCALSFCLVWPVGVRCQLDRRQRGRRSTRRRVAAVVLLADYSGGLLLRGSRQVSLLSAEREAPLAKKLTIDMHRLAYAILLHKDFKQQVARKSQGASCVVSYVDRHLAMYTGRRPPAANIFIENYFEAGARQIVNMPANVACPNSHQQPRPGKGFDGSRMRRRRSRILS